MEKRTAEHLLRCRLYEAVFAWDLDMFAELLKEEKGWKAEESGRKAGREALVIYLVQKYGWTIEYCRSLSDPDLRLALVDELKAWKMPEEFLELDAPISAFLKQNPSP